MPKTAVSSAITFIHDDAAAAAAVAVLCESPFVCLDTEFIRERTYRPEACLLQAAVTPEHAYLFDLTTLSVEPVRTLLTAPTLKVLHAARQDMELFHCGYGVLPERIFDTQIAAAVCGLGEDLGYGNLVKRLVGIEPDKSARRTDWKQRPLTKAQMDYAAADVTYLCRVYDALRALPQFPEREALMHEETAPMLDPELYAVRPELAWRRFRLRNESRAVTAAVRTLAAAREEAAAASDRSRNQILSDDALLEIARRRPADVAALAAVRFVPKSMSHEVSELIFQALRAAETEVFEEDPAAAAELTPVQNETAALLYAVLRLLSLNQGLSLRMYAGPADRGAVERLAAGDPDSLLLQGARRTLIGEQLLALCEGRASLRLHAGVPEITPEG